MTELTWSDELGKRVRSGTWMEQAMSTVGRIEEAFVEERWESAAELVDYFMEEAKVCYVIYSGWFDKFSGWLLSRGIAHEEFERLYELLSFPDGQAFDATGRIPSERWSNLGAVAGRLANDSRAFSLEAGEALESFEHLRESWRQLHDRWVDLLSGLMTLAAESGGETALEEMYRFALEPYIEERYSVYDLRERSYEETLQRNLYTSFEAMRGHLSGPGRRGEIDFEELDDRWVLRFDPCASGGRVVRGDPDERTGSRCEPPYSFGVTKERHDWAWNAEGICYYCAHCCLALERIPAERWGHPVRVVDPPRYPEDSSGDQPKSCSWTVYKSLEAIPDSAYLRIGLKKPDPE